MLSFFIKDEVKRLKFIRTSFTVLITFSLIFLIYYKKFYNEIKKIEGPVLEHILYSLNNTNKDIRLLDFRKPLEYKILRFKNSTNIKSAELPLYFSELKSNNLLKSTTEFLFFCNEYKEMELALTFVRGTGIKNKVYYFYKGFSQMDINDPYIRAFLD